MTTIPTFFVYFFYNHIPTFFYIFKKCFLLLVMTCTAKRVLSGLKIIFHFSGSDQSLDIREKGTKYSRLNFLHYVFTSQYHTSV